MVCYKPLQAKYSKRSDGKKDVVFSNQLARAFQAGIDISGGSNISIPCGNCIGCRLDRSREWAIRCMHEASLYDDNCFVTLTYSDRYMPKDGSLKRPDVQNFLKRLRKFFNFGFYCRDSDDDEIYYHGRKVRYFYCGEYGDKLLRPHYHLCLFNMDFPDKTFWNYRNSNVVWRSKILERLWPYGISEVGSLTFDSAAYVARYCVKKINGEPAKDHYHGLCPEFGQSSLKPGIGANWLKKYGNSDVWSYDEVISNGHSCKPPRYYFKLLERKDGYRAGLIKDAREAAAKAAGIEDNTYARLADRELCVKSRMKSVSRSFESGN